LLLALAERPQRVLTAPTSMLDLSRGRPLAISTAASSVQISRLRRKIEIDPKAPTLIKTVRNGGLCPGCECRRGGSVVMIMPKLNGIAARIATAIVLRSFGDC